MLFVGTSIIHPSTEGVFLLCNILDLLIYSIQLKITILRNLAYALGRKEKYHAAIKMTECVKKLSLKYDYGYKLCIAINDMSWIYRNLYENELQEEYYNIGKQQYRQAYYLALARKDNILAEKLKNGYQRFYQSDIEIV